MRLHCNSGICYRFVKNVNTTVYLISAIIDLQLLLFLIYWLRLANVVYFNCIYISKKSVNLSRECTYHFSECPWGGHTQRTPEKGWFVFCKAVQNRTWCIGKGVGGSDKSYAWINQSCEKNTN